MLIFLFFCTTSLWLVNATLQITSIHPMVTPINTLTNATIKGEDLKNIIVEIQAITGDLPTQQVPVIEYNDLLGNSEAIIQLPKYSAAAVALIRCRKSPNGPWSKYPILFQYYEQPSISECIPSQVSFTGKDLITIKGKSFFYSPDITVKLTSPWFDYQNKVAKVNYLSSTALEFNAPISSYPSEYSSEDYSVNISLAMDGINYVPMSGTFLSYKYQDLYKFGFIFPSPIDDYGWSYQQNEGRKEIEKLYPGRVKTTYEARVSEDQVYGVLLKFCKQDYDLIMAGSESYNDQCSLAAEHDDCSNSHILCTSSTHNPVPGRSSAIFANLFEAKYIAGLTAGHIMLKTDDSATKRRSQCVGYLGGKAISEVYRGFNAFALGCRRVNPNCTVKVMFLGTWWNPILERSAAEFMWHSEGCDIVAQETDSTEAPLVFTKLGGYSIGYNGDMSTFVGRRVLTSPYAAWGKIYAYFLDKLFKGPLRSEKYIPGMKEDAVNLWPFSNAVDSLTRTRVLEVWNQMKNGEFNVFCGKIKIPSGFYPDAFYEDGNSSKCLTDVSLSTMWQEVLGVEFISTKITDWGAVRKIGSSPTFYIKEYEYTPPAELKAIFMFFAATGIIVVLFTSVFMYKHRTNKWFKSHSVKLMFFILMSCFLQFTVPFILAVNVSNESCIMIRFVSHLAFIVCAPPICLKTYRLHKFFAAARHLRTARCTDKQLISWIFVALFFFGIYSVLWFTMNPPVSQRVKVTKLDKYVTVCSELGYWDLILFVPEIIILLGSVQLVAMIRSIPKQFNESKYIAFTLYTVFVLTIILGMIFMVTKDQEPLMTYFLENFGILVIAGVTFGSLFGVKIKKIFKNEQYASKKSLTSNFRGSAIGSRLGSGVRLMKTAGINQSASTISNKR